ncbi:MAG: hypothetical protein KAT28_02080 [Candidatus Aenigmarchaeota archaeon]|nr:hypothetical protein [Candidatus Aenigmarchaeota archaeon]
MSKEELEVVMKAVKEGLTGRLDDLDALGNVYEEVYGKDGLPHEIIAYVLDISRGNTTIEQAVNNYRNYLQDKKGLEENLIDSFPKVKEIIDKNGEREMIIKYKLEC